MAFLKKFIASIKKIFFGGKRIKKAKHKVRKQPSRRRKRKIFPKAKPHASVQAKKKIVPKPSKPAKVSSPKAKSTEKNIFVGEITHYFSKIEVVVVKVIQREINVGDKIRIRGAATNFVQMVKSLQIESVNVEQAKKGQLAGLKVEQKTKPGDKVYRIFE